MVRFVALLLLVTAVRVTTAARSSVSFQQTEAVSEQLASLKQALQQNETMMDFEFDGPIKITWGETFRAWRDKLYQALVAGYNLLLDTTSESVRGHTVTVWKSQPPALGDMYIEYFKKFANREWLVYQGKRLTFAESEVSMRALAAGLVQKFGIQKGDRVGIAMRNLPEFMLSFLGITYSGAVAVPLNALWTAKELEYAIKDSGMKLLIADTARLELCAPFLGPLEIKSILVSEDEAKVQELGAVSWTKVIDDGKIASPTSTQDIQNEDEAMIMYTSGSTGFPKGVIHTQRSVGASIKLGELAAKMKPGENDKSLLAVPLFHVTALTSTFLYSMTSGDTILMMYKWNAGEALRIIKEEKATKFTGVPTMVRDMLEHPNFNAEDFASMKQIGMGGAAVPPALLAQLGKKSKGSEGVQGYGLTETMGGVIVNSGLDYKKHPTSCGKPIPFLVQVKITDPATGNVLKDGERGELCIKSVFNMKGYNNRPEDTKKVIDENGYFHTGDAAKIEGGFVYILDRYKDIIIRGGENIDCSEVETAFYSHPAVREVSVFGLPDERLGEVVGAVVYTQQEVTAEMLRSHVASQLSKFKVPKPEHIFFVTEELPKGATGKINKKGLREVYKDRV